MTCLIASLSTGKGTWIHVTQVINSEKWEKIFIVTNNFGKENFKNTMNAELIILDDNQSLEQEKESVKKALNEKLTGTEVGLNLYSGTGKEHMAIISAILSLGYGFRLIAYTDNGVKEI